MSDQLTRHSLVGHVHYFPSWGPLLIIHRKKKLFVRKQHSNKTIRKLINITKPENNLAAKDSVPALLAHTVFWHLVADHIKLGFFNMEFALFILFAAGCGLWKVTLLQLQHQQTVSNSVYETFYRKTGVESK